MGTRVLGLGAALPDRVVENREFVEALETSDSWIQSRTGIESRRHLGPDTLNSDLAARAALSALESAATAPEALDMLLLSTCTPDRQIPASACRVQHLIGADNAGAADINAACCGFIYGLVVGDAMISAGHLGTVLVVASEAMSRVVDPTDRTTAVLFGDGAGGVLLGQGPESCVMSSYFSTAGQDRDLLTARGGGTEPLEPGTAPDPFLRMSNGNVVFRRAVPAMATALRQATNRAGVDVEDLAFVVPHQANARIMRATAEQLNYPMDQVACSVNRHGNTSSASIPLALAELEDSGRLTHGDLIGLCAFGAGLSSAATVLRWSDSSE